MLGAASSKARTESRATLSFGSDGMWRGGGSGVECAATLLAGTETVHSKLTDDNGGGFLRFYLLFSLLLLETA